MNISAELFQKDLILGSQGSYLSVSPQGLTVVPKRPSGNISSTCKRIFSTSRREIQQALNGRSEQEIHNFAMNIVYAVEKSPFQLFLDKKQTHSFTPIDIKKWKNALKFDWPSLKTAMIKSFYAGLTIFTFMLSLHWWNGRLNRFLIEDTLAVSLIAMPVILLSPIAGRYLFHLIGETEKLAIRILTAPFSSSWKQPSGFQALIQVPAMATAAYGLFTHLPRFARNFNHICEETELCGLPENITFATVSALAAGSLLWTAKITLFHWTRFCRNWRVKRSEIYKHLFETVKLSGSVRTHIEQSGRELAKLDEFWKRLAIRWTSKQNKNAMLLTYRRFVVFRHEMINRGYHVVSMALPVERVASIDFQTAVAKRFDPTRDLSQFKSLHFSLSRDSIPLMNVNAYVESADTSSLLNVSLNPWDAAYVRTWLNGQTHAAPDNPFAVLKHFSSDQIGKKRLQEGLTALKALVVRKEEESGKLKRIGRCMARLFSPNPGVLYAICIPQQLVEDPTRNNIYQTTEWGVGIPLDQDNLSGISQILKQQGGSTRASRGAILAPSLIPENGIKIRSFTTLSKAKRKEIREAVAALAQGVMSCIQQRPLSQVGTLMSTRQNLALLSQQLDTQLENKGQAHRAKIKTEVDELQRLVILQEVTRL